MSIQSSINQAGTVAAALLTQTPWYEKHKEEQREQKEIGKLESEIANATYSRDKIYQEVAAESKSANKEWSKLNNRAEAGEKILPEEYDKHISSREIYDKALSDVENTILDKTKRYGELKGDLTEYIRLSKKYATDANQRAMGIKDMKLKQAINTGARLKESTTRQTLENTLKERNK